MAEAGTTLLTEAAPEAAPDVPEGTRPSPDAAEAAPPPSGAARERVEAPGAPRAAGARAAGARAAYAIQARAGAAASVRRTLGRALRVVASLRLTVALLLLSMALVFGATLAQVERSTWAVTRDYLRSFVVVTHVGSWPLPLPGGYALGAALLANLLAAHAVRFKLVPQRVGLVVAHAGLIVLLVGELVTGLHAVEATVELSEGEVADFAVSSHDVELAFVARDGGEDVVVSVPEALLARGGVVTDAALPCHVVVDRWFRSAWLSSAGPARASGDGGLVALPRGDPGPDGADTPAAELTLAPEGGPACSLVVSVLLDPREVRLGDRTWRVALRQRRLYKTYSLELLDFERVTWPGTDVPRRYTSRVRLRDAAQGDDREVLIAMNEPLLHANDAIYQAGYRGDGTTILQVVENPGRPLPYVAVVLVGLGLTMHFALRLRGHLRAGGAK